MAGARIHVTSPESLPVLRRCGVIFALSNRTAISKELKRYRQGSLKNFKKPVKTPDAQKLEACFENAMKNRRGLVFFCQ